MIIRKNVAHKTPQKIIFASMLIGLSSLLAISGTASSSWANNSITSNVEAKDMTISIKSSEASADTLRQGLPGRRLGGGTRSDRLFAENYSYLAALTTSDNLSITTEERPTFIFSVPQMLEDQTAEFVLRNEKDELVYESTFQISREGGTITLDTNNVAGMDALAIDETYQWYFSIIPDEIDRANDAGVYGNIRRVDSEAWLTQSTLDSATLTQISSENPLEQARALYQQANLWHDAAVTLNELRQAEPENPEIASEWHQLLEFAGLANVIEVSEPTVHIGLN